MPSHHLKSDALPHHQLCLHPFTRGCASEPALGPHCFLPAAWEPCRVTSSSFWPGHPAEPCCCPSASVETQARISFLPHLNVPGSPGHEMQYHLGGYISRVISAACDRSAKTWWLLPRSPPLPTARSLPAPRLGLLVYSWNKSGGLSPGTEGLLVWGPRSPSFPEAGD